FFLLLSTHPILNLFPYTTLFRSHKFEQICRHRLRRQNVGYSNFSQPQSHLSFCVLLQYLVERRRVVTQILKQNAKRDEIEAGKKIGRADQQECGGRTRMPSSA